MDASTHHTDDVSCVDRVRGLPLTPDEKDLAIRLLMYEPDVNPELPIPDGKEVAIKMANIKAFFARCRWVQSARLARCCFGVLLWGSGRC